MEKGEYCIPIDFGISKGLHEDPFTKSLVEQIYIDDQGQFSLVPKVGNEKIVIGKLNNLKDKLSRLKFFYQEGLRYEGWNVYQTIDFKNDDQVVCKNLNQKHNSLLDIKPRNMETKNSKFRHGCRS